MSEIVSTDDVLDGAPRIEGRRIGVHHLASRVIDNGESPTQVAADYDLRLADVHRALAYYYDHPELMQTVQQERTRPPEEVDVLRGPEDVESLGPEPEA